MRKTCIIAALTAGFSTICVIEAPAQTCVTNPGSGPDICVNWDEQGSPDPFDDFQVNFSDEAFPNIELKRGSLTWRIWSVDTSNPNNIGDIGVISSPHAQNFAVRISAHSTTEVPGARTIKAINLSPTSAPNHSSVSYAWITGDLEDGLIVQRSSGDAGGHVNLFVEGDASGDIYAPLVHNLEILGIGFGSIEIDELGSEGRLFVDYAYGDFTIGRSLGEIVLGDLVGSLEITDILSCQGTECIDLHIWGNTHLASSIVINELRPAASVFIGTASNSAGTLTASGSLELQNGIPEGANVWIWSALTSDANINLNNGDVNGTLILFGGGEGTIIDGGVVDGGVHLGFFDWLFSSEHPFSGTASFAGTTLNGRIDTFGPCEFDGILEIAGVHEGLVIFETDMTESAKILIEQASIGLIILGLEGAPSTSASGEITIDGELTGEFQVFGTFDGSLCASNLSDDQPLPPNVQIAEFGAEARVCDTPADSTCTATLSAPQAEPTPVPKSRFISFEPGNSGTETAIRVGLTSLHHFDNPPSGTPDFSAFEGQYRYVNSFKACSGGLEPGFYGYASCTSQSDCDNRSYCTPGPRFPCGENNPCGAGKTCVPAGGECTGQFDCYDYEVASYSPYKCAFLGCEPEYRDWGAAANGGVLHVTGSEIVPSSVYHIQLLAESCTANWANYSAAIVVESGVWGDVTGTGGVPNNVANALDISAVVDKVMSSVTALPMPQLWLRNQNPYPVNVGVNVLDIGLLSNVLVGQPYNYEVGTCDSLVQCEAQACENVEDCGFDPCVDGYCMDSAGRCVNP